MTGSVPVRRVAVIGAGPAGAIAIDALAQEKAFDIIRVFERRERAGGCWYVKNNSLPPSKYSCFSLWETQTLMGRCFETGGIIVICKC